MSLKESFNKGNFPRILRGTKFDPNKLPPLPRLPKKKKVLVESNGRKIDNSPEAFKRRSDASKKKWEDPEYRAKQLKSQAGYRRYPSQ